MTPESVPPPTEATSPAAPMRRGPILVALVGVLAVGYTVDQVTKMLAVRHLDPADPPTYLGGLLSLKLIRNPGAAFSMGSGFTEVLSVLAILALLFCAVYLAPRVKKATHGAVLGLAMAGIAGNLTDRLLRAPGPLRGHVIDFFAVPRFAIFNVADICLTTAAGLVIVWSLVEARREAAAERAAKLADEDASTRPMVRSDAADQATTSPSEN